MTLPEELRALLDQATASLPTAAELRDHLAARARSISVAGPNLERPAWAPGVDDASDIFVELGGDVIGIHLWDDARGWGAYAELAVARGTLAEIETVTGPLERVPARPGGGPRRDVVSGYPVVAGRRLRVFVEHEAGAVKLVTVHFERAQ